MEEEEKFRSLQQEVFELGQKIQKMESEVECTWSEHPVKKNASRDAPQTRLC